MVSHLSWNGRNWHAAYADTGELNGAQFDSGAAARPDGWFERRCMLSADRTALMDEDTGFTLTYRELAEKVDMAARSLFKLGVRQGDRIGILTPNDSRLLVLLFACRRLGAMLVPLNWRLHVEELRHILTDCTPRIVWYHAESLTAFPGLPVDSACSWLPLDQLDESIELERARLAAADEEMCIFPETETAAREDDADIPWLMIYTGGTTGKPKGVVLTARSLYWNALNTAITWQLTETDVTPTVLPMFHTGGINALTLPVLMSGGKVICVQSFQPERMIGLLEREQCTIVLMVPTMYHLLVQSPRFADAKFRTMKTFLSGGAPCPMTVYASFAARCLPFKEGYGATESGPNNFVIDCGEALLKPGSVGLPMLFNDVRLIGAGRDVTGPEEVGELALRGKHLFHSYWNNEEATAEAWLDGWFLTGDLAKRDKDGYFYIVGRKKDMIITGGENVYPLEVEHLLERHPEVGAAAVVGVEHPKWGEIVAAAIVPKPGCQPTAEALQAYCALSIAKYKIPKLIKFIEELPKTAVGKLDKKSLFPLFAGGMEE
ncbi:class I adenylate-forming enzyme family protein [Paenibacillus azoreducens]|uniref:class I adenylate-forming enzyme family protein n=1 Tax=Paenibacillus azoreducens TaxID=116718 RepID=UPI001BB3C38E|nr:AMP-binding protein [Paenibacillus azoreducens]